MNLYVADVHCSTSIVTHNVTVIVNFISSSGDAEIDELNEQILKKTTNT